MCIFYWDLWNVYFGRVVCKSILIYDGKNKKKLKDKGMDIRKLYW